MQGVNEYGDFAIKVGLKLMAQPGKQFTVRRRAYALIKRAFAENGIEFAVPTVQVAGGEPTAAAAHASLQTMETRRRLILDQLAVSSRQRVMPARSRCIATARPFADASAPTAPS